MKNLSFKNSFITLSFLLILLLSVSHSNAQNISTIVGNGVAGYSGDGGPATAAEINFPGFLSFGGEGYGVLYIGDRLNYRIRETKLGPGAIIFTVAGDGAYGFSGDGGHADSAEISIPGGVTVAKTGFVYFCDYSNHCVRRIDNSGIITTIAGTPGVSGFSGDGGPALSATFDYPLGVTVDTVGNLFVADQYNHRIRKIDTFGIITTVVGTGASGYSGDGGPATAAEISFPNYIRMDSVGSLLVTDNGNQRIRRVDTNGIIETIAGTGVLGFTGDGGPATAAELNSPGGTTMDKYGNIFICDVDNDRIRKIDATTGNISTVAGTGVAGYSGDGGPATAAELNQPVDITVDHYNNVYFVDWNNSRIREFNSPSPASSVCDTVTELTISAITPSSAMLSWAAVTGSLGYEYTVNTTATSPTTSGTYTAATSVTVTGLLPGQSYYAHVLDSCGTSNLSTWINVPFLTTLSTNIMQGSGEISILAFPNPVEDVLTVQIKGNIGTSAYLIIDDVTGQHISTRKVTENTVQVYMKDLHSGIYFFRYIDDEHVQTLNVIKD